MERSEIGELIAARIRGLQGELVAQYAAGRHFVVDELLPPALALEIYRSFPPVERMRLRDSIRERKYVTAQMDQCDRLLEEAIYAFQDPRVVQAIGDVTGLQALEPDEKLYAGGISAMGRGHFLLPHLDNSHDQVRRRYRVLNLLYYTSPNWSEECGGSFELWPHGAGGPPLAIPSTFNRLLVVATHRNSWHSVEEVRVDRPRTCVSNYYFSAVCPEPVAYSHVTSFRGRPGMPLRSLVLRADAAARGLVKRVLGARLRSSHYYRKKSS